MLNDFFHFFSVRPDNQFYECTLCPAKSGRKDNIRRHVRNLHSESDDELRTILQKIFDNFNKKKQESTEKTGGKREEKTEHGSSGNAKEIQITTPSAQQSIEPNEPNEIVNATTVVRNIATSVIKFVGRSQDIQPSCPAETEKGVEPLPPQQCTPRAPPAAKDEMLMLQQPPKLCEVSQSQQKSLNTMQSTDSNTIDSIAEIGVNFPSLEPLNFDPFPDMTPLPLINTNTNLTVYRQLLSPYLRKPENSSDQTPNNTLNEPPLCEQSSRHFKSNSIPTPNVSRATPTPTLVIDRPPKKMIEKYEIYRK